jgi:hypothetical protein
MGKRVVDNRSFLFTEDGNAFKDRELYRGNDPL